MSASSSCSSSVAAAAAEHINLKIRLRQVVASVLQELKAPTNTIVC